MERTVSQIHTEIVPGTKIMTDVQGSHFYTHNSASSIALVPQPTEDIHDPLVSWTVNFLRRKHLQEPHRLTTEQNWSQFWKTIILINQGCFVIVSVVTALSVAPLTPIYMVEWKKSLTQVALLVSFVTKVFSLMAS